jgi:hypothetical protein
VRDGDPGALAELCARRGAAVLAFAEHVAAPGEAARAAADAFARFRATLVARARLEELDADALLLSATRSAALARSAHANGPLDEQGEQRPEECVSFDQSLVRWIEDELPSTARERFERHVADCGDCGAMLARLEAAERAYWDPPKAPLPGAITRAIVGALATAAPVTALGGNAARVREAAERMALAADPPPAAKQRSPGAVRVPSAANGAGARPGPEPDRGPAVRLRDALQERRRMAGRHAPVFGPEGRTLALAVLLVLTMGVVGVAVLSALDRPASGGGGGGVPAGVDVALIVFGVSLWMALIRWTYVDARRRLSSAGLVGASAALAVLPLAGPVVYMILRPPESLDDAQERAISIASSERLIALLDEMAQTQREIHAGVKRLEQALHASRRRAAARQAAAAAGAQA